MEEFFLATAKDIRGGRTTDVYFERTRRVLEAKGLEGLRAVSEFSAGSLPNGWGWSVLCGTEEVVRLFEGMEVDLHGIPEGTVFSPRAPSGARVPVLNIEGAYATYGRYETPALGMICHSSGVATMAARCKLAAGEGTVLAFGVRRMHPALAPVLDRASYIGGCDGVSSLMGAEIIGEEAQGTIPHALMMMVGDEEEAFRAFDEVIEEGVPRIALIDTFSDEKVGAMRAVSSMRRLKGVRMDTPGSRRGSFPELVQEVRWELDINGHEDVSIFASGGLDERGIAELAAVGVGGFGVGTCITNAPTVDFSMDIVEVGGRPVSKRGKFGGRKHPFRCPECLACDVALDREVPPTCACGTEMEALEVKLLEGGRRTEPPRSPRDIRRSVLDQLKRLP